MNPPAVKGNGKGKSTDQIDVRSEERKRTLVFNNFPVETQEKDIIETIQKYVVDHEEDVEAVFAYAKTGTRGAAKFHTEDTMWKFLSDKKGQHKYEFKGKRLYPQAG